MRNALFTTIASLCILVAGCTKTEQSNPLKDDGHLSENSSGLRLNAIGDYKNYHLTSYETGKTGQIADFSLDNGGRASVGDYKDEPHQKWRITRASNAYYKIMNMGSGKYLEAYINKGVPILVQASSREVDGQLWQITVTEGKRYKVISKSTGLAITSQGVGTVKLTAFADKKTQEWGYTELPPTSYRDDEVTRYFQRTTGTQAWDGNHSVHLTYGANKGKVLWITNDEFYNQLNASGKFRCYGTHLFFSKNNAAMLQPSVSNWDPAQTHNIFVTTKGKQYGEEVFHDFFGKVLWPTGVIELNDKIIVSLVQVDGLTILDNKIGIIDQDDNTSTVITVPGYSGQTEIEYSVGFFKDGDYAYVYGKDRKPNLYVARFALNNPTKWTFWDGKQWAARPSAASAARVLNNLPSGAISVSKVNGKYVVVGADFGFFCNGGRNFYSWTSAAPNAAFANKRVIFKRTDYKQGILPVFYTPVIHPQFNNGKNELLVTYCVNYYGGCIENCPSNSGGVDPDGYRPKAFRVPYSLIGL
ncbi:hypothetical protein DJ568_03405 [Mucilaginibacter hurinus]|uniref:Ricin B lectin domain-containing protein n=1 Tax=Mucilaginibacter hurinus TaxID=2201324 RepID=A0A367GSJ3_9SPHI|nr:RICIN domain-containing protein [Mucilaginibacter hurinus]RCH55816.1 hypothetical protein DJ568_03405 [Mucilaginibacter hurinus]